MTQLVDAPEKTKIAKNSVQKSNCAKIVTLDGPLFKENASTLLLISAGLYVNLHLGFVSIG